MTLFALIGFFLVPLGKKTGYEHARAIFMTPPAKEAGRELVQAGDKIKAKMLDEVRPTSAADAGTDAHPESLMCIQPAVAITGEDDAPDASVVYVTARTLR